MFQTEWSHGRWGGVGTREEEKREGARGVPGNQRPRGQKKKKSSKNGLDYIGIREAGGREAQPCPGLKSLGHQGRVGWGGRWLPARNTTH